MRYLILIVVGFVAFCGWLVAESGVFEVLNGNGPGGQARCVLLQQTTLIEKPETADAPLEQGRFAEGGKIPDYANFSATGGPARTVTLGAVDPNTEDHETGFKFQLQLSSKGAAINKATFSNGLHNGRPSGFNDRDPKNPQPLVILSPVRLSDGSEVLSMANKQFVLVQQQRQFGLDRLSWKSYDVERAEDGSQKAAFAAVIEDPAGKPVVRLTKTYRVFPGSYHLDFDVTIENLTDSEQEVRFNLAGPLGIGREATRADIRKVVGGYITPDEAEVVSSRQGIQGSFLSRKPGLKDATLKYEEALQTANQPQIEQAKESLRIGHNLPDRYKSAHFLWAAITNKYFASILRPMPDEGKDYCEWVADKIGWFYNPDGDSRATSGDETVGLNLEVSSSILASVGQPGSTGTYNFQLYIGPKDKSLFDKNELYRKLGFVQTIDFMPCFCCPAAIIHPLAFAILALMKWMYGFIGNYGVVIIILVFLMRLVIHPLTKKSQVSMSKFSKLAPKIEQIKKKYANNKAEMNKQMMALYKEHGASPIMGMLPMMVQMPIWIALWSAVYASIDLRGAPFLPFWITDLSAPDALFRFPAVTLPLFGKLDSFNLLPILMGVAFYLQQKLMPSQAAETTNPQVAQQQKMMKIVLPLLFPLMLYKGPSGVNLYIMSSVFAGVIEQYVIRKHIREKEKAESAGLVAATSKTGGKVKKKKPKPFFKQM